ncbi:MAG: hypothetical protein RML10_10775 [Geminocystis sp.]|nr:hypothetical protein [Geminocystis sp.]
MKQYTYINYGCFEGMLLHRSVVSIVGLPEKKFFLYYDDTYYGYMINKVTNVLYIKDICFVKKLKRNSHGLNKLELYLHFRNYIGYLARKVCEDKRRYWSLAIIFLLYHIFKNIAKLRIDRAYIVLKGFIDGIRENWGYEKKLLNKKR